MPVIGLFVRAVVVAAFAAAAVAQGLGSKVREAKWGKWLQGEPVAIGGDQAPACTVYSFHTYPGQAALFASDGDYLADLQKRFADKGIAVVAVVGDDKVAGRERWPGCRVVADDELATTQSWFRGAADGSNGDEPPWNVVVLGKDGDVRFLGRAESGLVDAIAATLAQRDVLGSEAEAFSLRVELPGSFDNATAQVVGPLTRLVAHAPHDGFALGVLYLAQATKANDPAAAKLVLQQALADLAKEARPLAAFADLALRGDPRRPGLAASLKPAVHAAAAAAPNDVAVQLAFLRTLVQCGDAREVGRQSMKLRKLVTSTAASCLDFAAILAQDGDAPVHKDLATMALDKAASLHADARQLAAARYGVARRCANDVEAGRKLLDEYLKDKEARVSINNDCWYLMTELPTMGRYDTFAAALADRMLEQKEAMDSFEFDTAALAMYLVGRLAEAVALQETAIDKGGKGNRDYEERLARYKTGLGAAPR